MTFKKFCIITSLNDPASSNIRARLLERHDFKETDGFFDGNNIFSLDYAGKQILLCTTEQETIYCDNAGKNIDAEFFIFASKHQSKTGINSLAVHSPGNWGKAMLGGEEARLCIAPANYLRHAFQLLRKTIQKNAPDKDYGTKHYEIIQEATHHGPFIENPCFFIEIGSSIEEWQRESTGRIVADTIIEIIARDPERFKTAFGIGGPHHLPNLTKACLESGYAIGHSCPKHNLEYLNEEMLLQAMQKTFPEAEIAILDWKGLGQEKERIVSLLEKLKVKYIKTKDL